MVVLSPDNVRYARYCRLKLLISVTVKIDCQHKPVDIDCTYISFFEIKLEPSGM